MFKTATAATIAVGTRVWIGYRRYVVTEKIVNDLNVIIYTAPASNPTSRVKLRHEMTFTDKFNLV